MDRPIDATATANVPFRHAEVFLRRPPKGLFGDAVHDRSGDGGPARRYRSHLSAEGPAGLEILHEVDIEVVAVRSAPESVEATVRWSPTGGGALLPSFTGTLSGAPTTDSRTHLSLSGSYSVPLGPVGRFGDGVVGKRVARQSIDDLLDRLARRLESLTTAARTRPSASPTPFPPDMRREARKEPSR